MEGRVPRLSRAGRRRRGTPNAPPVRGRRDNFELQGVEQVNAHRVERQDVDGEVDSFVVLGAVSRCRRRQAQPVHAPRRESQSDEPALARGGPRPEFPEAARWPVRTRSTSPSPTIRPWRARPCRARRERRAGRGRARSPRRRECRARRLAQPSRLRGPRSIGLCASGRHVLGRVPSSSEPS